MGGKRQKFPNIGWLVKLQGFRSNKTYFKFNSCQCSSISEEVVGTLGGKLNVSLAALFKTD